MRVLSLLSAIENPTFGLGKITVGQTPKDYFPPHEFDKIVDAIYAYRENRGEIANINSTRLRTMTLLMRWSGLRIRDAVTLDRNIDTSYDLRAHGQCSAARFILSVWFRDIESGW